MDEKKYEAARLAALGVGSEAIAQRVGVSARTVARWKQTPDFITRVRDHEPDASILSTLQAALEATKRDGTPDWPTRVSAARALATLRPAGADDQPQRTVTIFKERAA